MRNLKDYYSLTNEAQKALDNFYESIKREGKNYPASDIGELLESLNEHIEIAIKEKLSRSVSQRVDAQMMLEILYSLGDPAEIVSELGTPSEGRTENVTERITIKYKYMPVQKMLCRSSKDRWFFGVCGGFAEYFGVSSLLMRLLFIFSGVGILFYILLALLIPDEAQAQAGGRSAGVDLIVSAVRGLFLLFMCIIYIPVLFSFAVAALVSFNNLFGAGSLFKTPFTTFVFGSTSNILLGFFGLILSVSVLTLLLNFIMQVHFNGGFLKIGSRNVYAFAIVASLIGISMVFGHFNRYTKYAGESIEHFEFKAPGPFVDMIFSEKETDAPIFDKSIVIAGAEDGGDTIQVDVVKTAYGPNEDAAREHSKDMDVKIDMQSGDKMSFVVSSKDAGRSYYTFPKVKMTVKIPSKTACRVQTDNILKNWNWQWFNVRGDNDLSVSKLKATAEIEVKNTNVSIADIDAGKLSLTGASGNVTASNVKSSEFAVEVTNGNVGAEKIESKNCTIKSTTGNIKTSVITADVLKCESNVGNVTLYKASVSNESVVSSNVGNVKVNFAALKNKSTHEISSNVGNISLTIPESAAPKVVAKSKSNLNNMSNDFEGANYTDESPVVTVKTNVGNVRIKKD